MIAIDRAARGRLPRIRAGARREPEDVDVPHLSRHAVFRRTRRRTRRTSRRVFRRAACRSTKAPALYFHVSPDEVWIGGGMYAPQPPQLHAVREHIAAHVKRLRAIVESPAFRKTFGALEGEGCSACRAGFPKDHAAAEYLKYRQFLAGRELPAALRERARSSTATPPQRLPPGGAARALPERAARAGRQ